MRDFSISLGACVARAYNRAPTAIFRLKRGRARAPAKARSCTLEALEPRLLLSADPLLGLGEATNQTTLTQETATAVSDTMHAPQTSASPSASSLDINALQPLLGQTAAAASEAQDSEGRHATPVREVVFVDANVSGPHELSAALGHDFHASNSIEVIVLDTERDGVVQVAQALSQRQDLYAVHIVSHGANAELTLGAATLSTQTLSDYQQALVSWGDALGEDSDLLFYGCDVASGEQGRVFLSTIAELTGADVAASSDLTGHQAHGGDWVLEFATGAVHTDIVFDKAAQNAWVGTLGSITVTTFSDEVDGTTTNISALIGNPGGSGISLREAVIATNNTPGADEIRLGAGIYTLTRSGVDELADVGDLDILDDLTIIGNSAGDTTITAVSGIRLFEVNDNASHGVDFANLKLEGANVGFGFDGAAIRVLGASATPVVTLSNVWISGNTASAFGGDGGGIHNAGDLIIINSTIEGNQGDKGGGVHNTANANLTIENSTISGNTALNNEGGGLYNTGTAVVNHVTITANDADTQGGGIYDGNALFLSNSVIAGNTATDSGPDIRGDVTSLGSNIIGDQSDTNGFVASDQLDTDPLLSPLASNGGPTPTHGLGATSPALGGATAGASIDQRGASRDGAPDIGAYEAQIGTLLLSVEGDSDPSDTNLSAWNAGDVVSFGPTSFDSGTTLPATTAGSFAFQFRFSLSDGSHANIRALHVVSAEITLGSGANTFDLMRGDVIAVLNGGGTLQSNNTLSVSGRDVFVFRPDVAEDYSAGTYTMLLEDPLGGNIHALSLVESDVSLVDVTLTAGSFLFARSGTHEDVRLYDVTGVGAGAATSGTMTTLVDGSDLGFSDKLDGIELVEHTLTLGDVTLRSGNLLLTVEKPNTVSGLPVAASDIFVLDLSSTEYGAGTAGTATLLFDGGDVSLATNEEVLDALSVTTERHNSSPIATISASAYAMNENTPLVLQGTGLSIMDADAQSDVQVTLSVTEGVLTVFPGSTGVAVNGSGTQSVTLDGSVTAINDLLVGNGSASFAYEALDAPSASATLILTIDDQDPNGALIDTDTASLLITPANDAPILDIIDATTLADISQGMLNTLGTTVADLVASGSADPITDADPGAVEGIAVTSVDDSNGVWQYSTDDASTWVNFAAQGLTRTVDDGSAVLLAEDARVRFVPDVNYSGNAGDITFRAWDQTSGANGDTAVDVSTNGGETAFSAASETATLNVVATNSASSSVHDNQSITEEGVLEFSTAIGNAVVVNAATSGDPLVQVSLSVTNGTITLVTLVGLSVESGANGSANVVVSGQQSAINAALDGMRYTPNTDYSGSANLQVTTSLDVKLEGLYDFENAASIGEDTSPSVLNSGTANGEVSAAFDAIRNGDVLVLDGVDDFITIPGVFSSPPNVTLAAWVNVSALDGDVISLGDSVLLRVDTTTSVPNGGITGFYHNGVSWDGTISGVFLGGTGWHHIAYVIDDTNDTQSIYIDGALAGSSAHTTSISYTLGTATAIGKHGVGSRYFYTGSIDDARIYTRALTADEIAATARAASNHVSNVNIAVTPVNDAPTATIVSTNYAVYEHSALALQGTGLSVGDVDAGSATAQVTLAVTEGALTVAAGTSGVVVGGNGTASVTLDGTLADINTLLSGGASATITYQALAAPSALATLNLSVNDLGNSGAGVAQSASDTATLTITAQNDAPTATIVPTNYAVSEDTAVTLHGTGLSIGDVDAGGAAVRATLAVTEGALTVGAGTTGVVVSGSGTATVTLDGTLADINTLLSGGASATITYQALAAPSALATLNLSVNDLGNSGAGVAQSASDTATLTITAQNDAPTATIVPTNYAVSEHTTLALHGTGLSISDVDAGGAAVQATLFVTEGELTVAAGTSGVVVSGSGTTSVTLDGTIADINTLLSGGASATITYQALAAPSALATLNLSVNDLGNSGAGVAQSASDTATLTIAAQNDPPTATIVSTNYAVSEHTALALQGTGLSVGDVDAGSAAVRATLAVTEGVLTVAAGTSGVVVSGNGTASVTLDGTLAEINTLLSGGAGATIAYQALAAPSGIATLSLSVNDLGNSGAGVAQSASDTATLTITAQNDAPTATIVPTNYALNEDTALVLQGTGLSIGDVDAGISTVRATLAVTEGALTVAAGTTGVVVSGSGTTSVTLDGTLADINALLSGSAGATISYQAVAAPSSVATLTLSVNDLGNSGAGVAQSASDTATLTITAQNDAPTATITPTNYAVSEHTVLALQGTGLSVGDVDAGTAAVRVTLAVTEGVLTVAAGTSGVVVTDSGTSTVTLDGTLAEINTLLSGGAGATIAYQALAAPSSVATLTLLINDLGNSGAGVAQSASDTATLTITAQNDAPTATITPADYAVNEHTALALHGTGLSIGDVDAHGAALQATLAVTEGALNVAAGTSGVVVTDSGTSTVTLDGTVAQINTLLSGGRGATITYQALAAPSALATLNLTVNDLGNTGGTALSASDTASLMITAQNDAPSAHIAATYTAVEDTTLGLHGTGLSIADVDAAASILTTTVEVGEGTLLVDPGQSGVTVVGSGGARVVLQGSLVQISALLDGDGGAMIHYMSLDAPSQHTVLSLAVDDGFDTHSDATTVEITPVNDAPHALSERANYSVSEDSIVLSGTGLNVTDVDGQTTSIEVTLSVSMGTLIVSPGTTGAQVTTPAKGSVRITGTVTEVNAVLYGDGGASVVYNAPSDVGVATTELRLVVNDLGNIGLGGPKSDTLTVSLSLENNADVQVPTELIEDERETATSRYSIPEEEEAGRIAQPAIVLASLNNDPLPAVASEQFTTFTYPQVKRGEKFSLSNREAPEATAEPSVSPNLGPLAPLQISPTAELEVSTSDFDALRDDILADNRLNSDFLASSAVAATGISIGYVVWLVRAGALLSSMISSMPAWRFVDPLPVLAYADDEEDDDEDGDSLQNLVTEQDDAT